MGQGLNCSSGILQDRRDSGRFILHHRLGSARFGFLDLDPQKINGSTDPDPKNINQKLQKKILFT